MVFIEYAKSGRATCRKCHRTISNGSMRICYSSRSDEYFSKNYIHLRCYKPTRKLSTLSGASQLTPEDKRTLKEYIEKWNAALDKKYAIKNDGGKKGAANKKRARREEEEEEEENADDGGEAAAEEGQGQTTYSTTGDNSAEAQERRPRNPNASLAMLPPEITLLIFSYMTPEQVCIYASLICKDLYTVSRDDMLWYGFCSEHCKSLEVGSTTIEDFKERIEAKLRQPPQEKKKKGKKKAAPKRGRAAKKKRKEESEEEEEEEEEQEDGTEEDAVVQVADEETTPLEVSNNNNNNNNSNSSSSSSSGTLDELAALPTKTQTTETKVRMFDVYVYLRTKACVDCGAAAQRYALAGGPMCAKCRKSKRNVLITKTEAKRKFKLTDGELDRLPHKSSPNPHNSYWAPMKQYLPSTLRRYVAKRDQMGGGKKRSRRR